MPRSHDHEESVFNPVQVLILALFLQLLVFFMLMNSISVFSQAKDRMRQMSDSVRGLDSLPGYKTSIFPNMGLSQGEGTAESPEDYMARFAHEIPSLTDDKPANRTGRLEVTVGASEMNRFLGLVPGTSLNPRISEMVNFVAAHKKDGYRFAVIKTIRPEVYAAGMKDPAPSYYALYLWTEKLMALGVPAEILRVGLAAGPAGGMTLRIERTSETDLPAGGK